MLSRSSSIISSQRGETYPQYNSTDLRLSLRDTNSSVDYLDENLLDEVDKAPSPAPPQLRPPAQPVDFAPFRDRETENPRLVIAIDYGTTFTGVAFALTTSDVAELSNIELITDWGENQNILGKVPSVYSYSPAPNKESQWGTYFSEGAVTMMNTKLELDVSDRRVDELELTLQVLEGVGSLVFDKVKRFQGFPEYTHKAPGEIVADYLTKVFEAAWKQIQPRYMYGTTRPPVDIVVTVPVNWSYQATNQTFRAVRCAGFNEENIPTLTNMILLTEPAAASYFVIRHFQERGSKLLKINEPFILCDAGGGTVDVIAYQVKQLKPQIELTQLSLPTKDKCGSAYVDTYFKRWLRRTIGQERYRELDPSYSGSRIGIHTIENGLMRKLITAFEVHKKSFSNHSETARFDLPGPLSTLTVPGVIEEGEVRIQPTEMKTIFNDCVCKVISLIEGQRKQVEMKSNRRVKNVFLVGGFGESPYLQEELEKSLKMRENTKMSRPETAASWTAVVKGAVIYGIEKARQGNSRLMLKSERSYGIVVDDAASWMCNSEDCYIHPLTDITMAREQFAWMVRRGDLILSDGPRMAEKEFARTFRACDSRRFELPVYVYPDDDDDVPTRWATGKYDVEKVGSVQCDVSRVASTTLQTRWNYGTKERYLLAYLVCKIRMTLTTLEVEVLSNDAQVGHTTISINDQQARRLSIDSLES